MENINAPLISIITPCYNSENYIGRYLDSILAQTYKKIQVILINDGSEDNTERIIFAYKQKIEDSGILFAYCKHHNKGIGGAINTGLKLVKGDFFTWCDSDNFFDNKYLQKSVDFLQNNINCNILRCDAYTVMEGNVHRPINRFSDGNYEKFKKNLFDNLISEKNIHFGCTLLKTIAFDKVVKNREIYPSRAGQNWQLLLPMFYYYDADYIDEPLFYFVVRKDSVSNRIQYQSFNDVILHYDEHEKIILETIKHLPVNQKDYFSLIQVRYIKKKLRVASDFQYKDETIKYHNILKKENEYNILDTIMYYRGKYTLFYFLYSIGKYPLAFLIKLRRRIIFTFS